MALLATIPGFEVYGRKGNFYQVVVVQCRSEESALGVAERLLFQGYRVEISLAMILDLG
jgi:hypothetical protein